MQAYQNPTKRYCKRCGEFHDLPLEMLCCPTSHFRVRLKSRNPKYKQSHGGSRIKKGDHLPEETKEKMRLSRIEHITWIRQYQK